MAVEIEHKYLVHIDLWRKATSHASVRITQAYMLTDPNKTIRVRTMGTTAFITIKGKTIGASRAEFEYEIPLGDAQELIAQFCHNCIDKTRHYVNYENKLWEVDEFHGENQGLIVAEIELNTETETYTLPNWVGENVTTDMRYTNAKLSVTPYTAW
jgi:adenylate cyclase